MTPSVAVPPPLDQSLITARQEAGRELLGPVFYEFCFRLWHYEQALQPQEAAALYAARGGLRLRLVFARFLAGIKRPPPLAQVDFYTSRVAAAKAALVIDPERVAPIIAKEFSYRMLDELVRTIAPAVAAKHDLTPLQQTRAETFPAAIANRELPVFADLWDYFGDQHRLFSAYLRQSLGTNRTAVLVDSGWEGSTQGVLMRCFPECAWFGLHFGRWNYQPAIPWQFAHIAGLSVDSLSLSPLDPRRAIFDYHHLIEGSLEVPIASVQGYVRTPDGTAAPDVAPATPAQLEGGEADALWRGVLAYVDEHAGERSAHRIRQEADRAFRRIERAIRRPTHRDIELLEVAPRSADFGKTLDVPILLRPSPGSASDRAQRCRDSLWRQGQLRLEYGVGAGWRLAWDQILVRSRSWRARLARLRRDVLPPVPRIDPGAGIDDPVLADLVRRVARRLSRLRPADRTGVVVFGAAPYGDGVVQLLRRSGIEPLGFFDNSDLKIGTQRDGLPVRKPERDPQVRAIVITSIAGRKPIGEQMQALYRGQRLVLLP